MKRKPTSSVGLDKTQSSVLEDDDTQEDSLSPLYSKIEALNVTELLRSTKSEQQKPLIQTAPKRKERPVLDQDKFDKTYGYRRVDLTLGRRVNWHFRQIAKWKGKQWLEFICGLVPIAKWLPSYKWKEWIIADLVGGIMCSIMSVPQGLAYGYMVGVPPNYGLITGIFGPLVYAALGTSRHTSPGNSSLMAQHHSGSFAIVSLMVGSAVQKYAGPITDRDFNGTEPELTEICCRAVQVATTTPADAISVATTMTLLIIFALLNMGLLAVWLSDQLVQGLTSGAAIHVLTSQLKSMTGIRQLPPTNDPFSLTKFYICFGYHITEADIATVIVALISVGLLLFSCYFIDPILKKWTTFKFPMEFIVVLGSVLLVWLSQGTRFEIKTQFVGHVDSGLVLPMMPHDPRWSEMIGDAMTTAVISFVIHISMAKMIAKKLNYEVDVNQEWLALGFMHLLSSFFGCFAGGSSLGRSMTQVKFGTKSQLSTLICCVILVGFVYGAASVIYFLPKPVLAAIVVVAMKDLYIQLFRSFNLFRQSYVDFLIYFITLLTVVFVNVMYGLIIGVCFALLSVVFRTQWAESTCLGRIAGTADFKGIGHYRTAEEISGIKVFRFDAPLYFANAETFISRMHQACGVNPIQMKAALQEKEDEEKKKIKKKKGVTEEEVENLVKEKPLEVQMKNPVSTEIEEDQRVALTHIIIDCSSIPYVDLMGKDVLAQVYQDYASIDITVFFSHCKVAVRQLFETTDFYTIVPKIRMFVSLEDAVTQAQRDQNRKKKEDSKEDKSATELQERKSLKVNDVITAPVAHSPTQKTQKKEFKMNKLRKVEKEPSIESREVTGTIEEVTGSNTALGRLEDWPAATPAPPPVLEQKSQDSMDKTQ